MDFEISKVEVTPITCNYEELKVQLLSKLELYRNLTYTDGQLINAKADRAKLNALYSSIDEKRKEIKRECLKPFEEFESQAKELLAIIKEPITLIDNQVKEFENAKKERKLEDIKDTFNRYVSTFSSLKMIELEDVFDDKWLNVTATMKNIEKAMYSALERLDSDIKAIKAFNSEFEISLINEYLFNKNMSSVLVKKKQLEEMKAERDKETCETTQSIATQPTNKVIEQPQSQVQAVEQQGSDRLFELTFVTNMTIPQMKSFKEFININNIPFKIIEQKEIK